MRYSIKDYSISAARKGWGQGWPTCTAKTQVAVITAPISGVKVAVHKRVARLAYLLIAETERRGYLLRGGQTWGGNCRAIAGTTVSSNHAWWLAIDINSLANPYIKKGLRVTDVPDWMVLLWNSFGWAWGGAYGDSMHWEFMGSPEDADDMTALAEQRLAHNLGAATPDVPEDDMYTDKDRERDQAVAAMAGALHYMLLPQDPYPGPRGDVLNRLNSLFYALVPEDGVNSQGEPTKRIRSMDVALAVLASRESSVRLSAEQIQDLASALHPVDAQALARALADEQDRRARDGDPVTGPTS